MFVAIDIGGTNCRVAAYDSVNANPRRWIDSSTFKMTGDYKEELAKLIEAIDDCKDISIEGIGIAIAGALNADQSEVVAAGNLSHWIGQRFRAELEEEFNVDVTVGNDAYCNTLAELTFAGASEQTLGITWGSGVGGCFGRVPAEPGHVIVDPSVSGNPVCGCGRIGCMESFAGGSKIEQKYGVKHAGLITPRQQDRVINAMASGLTSILCAHPAQRVIFSGWIACHQPDWVGEIYERVRSQYKMGVIPTFHVATFREHTGLVGALALLTDQN